MLVVLRMVPLSVALLPLVSKPKPMVKDPVLVMMSCVSVMLLASKRRVCPPLVLMPSAKMMRLFVPSAAAPSMASAPPLMMVAPL